MNCYAKDLTAWQRKQLERGRAHLLALWSEKRFTDGHRDDFRIEYLSSCTEPPDLMLDRFVASGSAATMPDEWIDFTRRHNMQLETTSAHGFSVYVPITYYTSLNYLPFETSPSCLCEQAGVFLVGAAIVLAALYTY